VVLDARLDALQPGSHLLDGSFPALVLHAADAAPRDDRYARVELAEIPVMAESRRVDLDAVLKLLAVRGVNELQIEAGPTLCGALFEQGLVDELLLYVAPTLLGDRARPLLHLPQLESMTDRPDWRVIDHRMFGRDQRLLLRPTAL
jgi:diaminohydroxyphosphoribosylaminopyrimidine deaminase/5-amino-6-(5-phosphoribosylamino)uracil reductase